MSGYYGGMRKFALGGKGWTIVLGTTVSLSYVRTRDRWQHEDNSQPHQSLENERGDAVRFQDQPRLPQHEDIVLRLWRQLPEVPLPNMYVAGGLLSAVWAYRMWGAFTRLMVVRYSDIGYQLRRPDVLAHKVVALKYFALPLAVVPGSALLGYWLVLVSSGMGASGLLQEQTSALREALAEPCREVGLATRNALDPLLCELSDSPLAIFARRSQTVGREMARGGEVRD